MTTPLRLVFGGSNRKHHLRMSGTCTIALLALSVVNPGVMAWGYWLQMPHEGLWIVAGAACYGHELWATADRDVEHKRKPPCLYWLPYERIVGGHRGILSHGLVIGTVARVAYGWWPVMLALGALWQVSPFWAAWLGVACGIGCFVNDLGHLALDL